MLYLLLAWTGYWSLQCAFGGLNMSMFSDLEDLARMSSLAILTIIALIVGIRAYRKKRKIWNLVPSVFGIIVIAIVIYKDVQKDRIRRMENLMIVSSTKSFRRYDNGITYYFKKGTRFTLFENRTEIMYYGKYSISGDRIRIISSNYNGKEYTMPKEGIIRDSVIYWMGSDSMKITLSEPGVVR